MATFFSDQLDFILFFYGLAFILLGAVCFAVSRTGGQTIPWNLLGAFAYLHGTVEWLDLLALILGDNSAFALSRTALMTASYALLVEFGWRDAVRSGLRIPARWVYLPMVPMLLTVVWGWHIAGVGGANAFARYIFALPGCLLGCVMLTIHARAAPGPERRWLVAAVAALAAYGFAAGAVVPSTPNWQGDLINYDTFTFYTGMPVQFVRGVLACFLAFSIWAYWGQRLIVDVASSRYAKFQHRQFISTLVALGCIMVAGWFLTQVLGDVYKRNMEDEALGDLNLIASRLAGETAATEGMVRALAGSRAVGLLAVNSPKAERQRAVDVLSLETEASGAVEGFILNKQGIALATSVRAIVSPTAWVGENFSETPYFKSAMANGPGYHYVVAAGSQTTSYYVSYPIHDGDGKVVGVAVLKKSLARFETDMQQFDRSFAMVDRDGVVVLTNRPEMRFHTLWPLPANVRARLTAQYGPLNTQASLDREIIGSSWTQFDGSRDYVQRRGLEHGDWTLVTWKIPQGIFASRILGIVVTLQLTIMALMYLVGRERFIHDKVQMEKRFELEELARNLDYTAATDPLTGLFNRRKFDRSLATEIKRAQRYRSPLSLVMFDIDHFKKINDIHGHPAGDTVLVELSRYAAMHIRETDVLARWGGEEFVVLCPGCDGPMASYFAGHLRADFSGMDIAKIGNVTCSFGVAEFVDGDSGETLLARADEALYRAKSKGRNRVEMAAPPATASPEIVSPEMVPLG